MMGDMSMTKGIGTPLYMAPEMMKDSSSYSSKADVYSFGIMIGSVVDGGVEPYKGDKRVESAWELASLVIQGLRPNVKKAKRMPPELIFLMNQCWDDNPDNRPGFDVIVPQLESMLGSK